MEELLIPKEMGSEYDDYLALQRSQGFDLAKYAGKTVKRYTYQILNYPTGEQGVQVSLLIYKNTVVAADVLSPALNGFMHGLGRPSLYARTDASPLSRAPSGVLLFRPKRDGSNEPSLCSFYDLLLGLQSSATSRAKKIAAPIPPAVAVRGPVSTPSQPSSATARATPLARQ